MPLCWPRMGSMTARRLPRAVTASLCPWVVSNRFSSHSAIPPPPSLPDADDSDRRQPSSSLPPSPSPSLDSNVANQQRQRQRRLRQRRRMQAARSSSSSSSAAWVGRHRHHSAHPSMVCAEQSSCSHPISLRTHWPAVAGKGAGFMDAGTRQTLLWTVRSLLSRSAWSRTSSAVAASQSTTANVAIQPEHPVAIAPSPRAAKSLGLITDRESLILLCLQPGSHEFLHDAVLWTGQELQCPVLSVSATALMEALPPRLWLSHYPAPSGPSTDASTSRNASESLESVGSESAWQTVISIDSGALHVSRVPAQDSVARYRGTSGESSEESEDAHQMDDRSASPRPVSSLTRRHGARNRVMHAVRWPKPDPDHIVPFSMQVKRVVRQWVLDQGMTDRPVLLVLSDTQVLSSNGATLFRNSLSRILRSDLPHVLPIFAHAPETVEQSQDWAEFDSDWLHRPSCLVIQPGSMMTKGSENVSTPAIFNSKKNAGKLAQWRDYIQQSSRDRAMHFNGWLLDYMMNQYRLKRSGELQSDQCLSTLGTQLVSPAEMNRILVLSAGASHETMENKCITADALQKVFQVYFENRHPLPHAWSSSSASEEHSADSILERCGIRKEALNKYEKRFLTNLVSSDAESVRFKDIACHTHTKELLQTIIALPLLRPSLFHGILEKSLSGVLLFGPPGTGKTMLAKAVASECGSTFLNITPSSIFNMYVGEGEKNAKAVFSLARKLAPCVVFVDELDALFDSRDSSKSMATKREILNEFMAEWDGLMSRNDGVVVVGATNRPFDLDDAVLRRLPRRILINLPCVEEREQILAVALRDEILDTDVNLKAISGKTHLYSGSDLKNLCISAALRAVREHLQSEGSNGDDSTSILDSDGRLCIKTDDICSTYRRVLRAHHFDKALEDVASSLSDDQESLERLWQWDRRYGDGRTQQERRKVQFGF